MEELYAWTPFLRAEYWTPGKGTELAIYYRNYILVMTVLYIPSILLCQKWMQNRKPMKLKLITFFWNLFLSIFSITGATIMGYHDYSILAKIFFHESGYSPPTRAVITFFTLTKALEFGDTALLVLKKKPLVFLHVYHHFTVTLFCWHAQSVNVAFGHHFAFINLCIHGVMYLYYALAVMSPRHFFLLSLRPYITMSQTVQMFVGMYLSYKAICAQHLPDTHHFNAWLSMLMYTSYAYLFGKFYLENYLKKFRPVMTLLVGTIHIMAVAGAIMAWHHSRLRRMVLEILGGYCLTALLLWLASDAPFEPASQQLKEDKKISSYKDASISSELSHGSKNSCLHQICRVFLMFLNCLATWASEHKAFRLRRKMLNAFQFSDWKEHSSYHPNGNQQTKPSKTSEKNDNSKQQPTELNSRDTSMLLSLLTKVDPVGSTEIKPAANTENAHELPCNNLTLVACPPTRPLDTWFAILCFGVPAIYGLNVYGDLILGLCVHGALRWLLELYSTGKLLSDMHIPKYGRQKCN